jgi:UPF0755 protein
MLRSLAGGPSVAPDYDGQKRGQEVVIEISEGETGSQIATKLYQAGVVKSSLAFFRIAVTDARSERIAPGGHTIETRIPAALALEQLLDPDRIINLIRVRDGARISEIAESLNEAGFSMTQIRVALTKVKPPSGFKAKSLEGFLYPAFYAPKKTDGAVDLLEDMVARFQSSTSDIPWNSTQYSPDELLTIASLVEAEGTPDVHAKVARVIFNRLKIGMPLQLDATINYIKDRRGEIRLTSADTKIVSEYNTYQNRGLPPGPIGSPTRASILATLDPAVGDWLYFVTVSPKETKFTNSYEEFLKLKREYQRNYRDGLFK